MIKIRLSGNPADISRAARAIAGALTETERAADCTSSLRKHRDGCKILRTIENAFVYKCKPEGKAKRMNKP